jgi:hypothetical protein
LNINSIGPHRAAVLSSLGVADVLVAVDEASSVGTIEGASAPSMMTVLVEVEVRQDWTVAT